MELPAAPSTTEEQRKLDEAYERALIEAGVRQDDLALLRQMAEHGRLLAEKAANPQLTRVYL